MASNRPIEREATGSLDSQLVAYSAAAGAALALDAGRATRPSRVLTAHSAAAAGLGFVGALNVDAAIHYTPTNITMSAGHTAQSLDFDGGGSDLSLRWIDLFGDVLARVQGGTASADVARDGTWAGRGNLKNFGYGATISAGKATSWPNQGFFTHAAASTWRGNLSNGSTGYVGIRFNSGGTKYGWIHIDSIAADLSSYHVAAYGYQDDGTASYAGEPEPVPEPSTIALALLASGAAGVMASRRKKILKGRK